MKISTVGLFFRQNAPTRNVYIVSIWYVSCFGRGTNTILFTTEVPNDKYKSLLEVGIIINVLRKYTYFFKLHSEYYYIFFLSEYFVNNSRRSETKICIYLFWFKPKHESINIYRYTWREYKLEYQFLLRSITWYFDK